MLDPYSILGVTENSTFEEIKQAYKKLAIKYHPDSNSDDSNNEKMAEINAAYDYFKEIFNGKTNSTFCSQTNSKNNHSTHKEYTKEERERMWEESMKRWEENRKAAYRQSGRNMRVKIEKVLEPIRKQNKIFNEKIKNANTFNELYNLSKDYGEKIEKMILVMYEYAEKSHRYGMPNYYEKEFNEEIREKINKNIKLEKVNSSIITGIGYDNIYNILYVQFYNDSLYCYFDVSEYVYSSFLSSESKGKFLEKNIKSNYRFERIQ